MLTFLSAVTSVKDYVDVVHALMYHDPMWSEVMTTYVDPGAILTYSFLFCKELLIKLFTFGWLPSFPSLPSLIPEVTRSMLTELSVFDSPALRFPNMFTFLETPISYGPQNIVFYSLEKFIIGLFNSLFFCLPTSLAHIICMRRFVMQGVDAGYLAGLGTIAGNLVWISCIVLGFRWVVIPWIHFDVLRYAVGTAIVLKYLWDSYRDRRVVLTAVDEYKAFMLNFVLAFLEQSMVFPFISNLSIGSDSTLIESFPTDHVLSFFLVHFAYLGGLLVGSLTLLQAACWFWEEPAFRFYMWAMSTFKISTVTYYNLCNFFFLYASMFFAMANLAYFGTDYLLTKPLGYLPQDRLVRSLDIVVAETSYLGVKASSRNTRINEGRHTRRERWKKRHKKFRVFDSALYDDGIYDLFTVEDLNYGFHRFWLRRKMRTHKGNYRLLPGKRVRKYKADVARTKLENFLGPRFEFTRMLFETVYTPTFHQYQKNQQPKKKIASTVKPFNVLNGNQMTSAYTTDKKIQVTDNLRHNNSALRKFVRKLKLRLKEPKMDQRNAKRVQSTTPLYSKRWRHLFSRIYHRQLRRNTSLPQLKARGALLSVGERPLDKHDALVPLSDRDRLMARYQSYMKQSKDFNELNKAVISTYTSRASDTALRAVQPLSFYLKREDALRRKFEAYGPNVTRANALGTNLHVFNPLTRRLFFYPKSTERYERAMQVARLTRKRTRESGLQELFIDIETKEQSLAEVDSQLARIRENPRGLTYSNDYWALITKRGQRLRHQIFKDVLQHWYYNPYNRFLVQWDMDSFIRRQPRSYFVNKEDQKQLHLRRVLLNDYFQTFRWYARMDQYHTMKQRIGGTKSLRSRVYNQQFQGTFKRVRHLFAVTPTLETQPILKFDQPLFNEYPNTSKNPVTAQSFIHEELNYEPKTTRGLSRELWDQTAAAVALALTTQAPARKNYLDHTVNTHNPGKASRFLFRGKKTRGYEVSSGARRHLDEQATVLRIRSKSPKFDPRPYVDSLWLSLLERAADFIYDEEALKYAVEDFADDTYAEELQQEKLLKRKMQRLKQWAVFMNTTDPTNPDQANLLGGLTRASSEAIKDALYFQNDIKRQNLNRRKTRPLYPDRYNQLTTVKKVLKRRYQQRFLDQLKAEENVYEKTKDAKLLHSQGVRSWAMYYLVRPFKTVALEVNDRVLAPVLSFVTKPFRAPEDPDFYYWGKREEAYDIESEVEFEIDSLRRRIRKKRPRETKEEWREREAQKEAQKYLPSKRDFKKTAKKYTKLMEEDLPKEIMAEIPRRRQAENVEDLKALRIMVEAFRRQQKEDALFFSETKKEKPNKEDNQWDNQKEALDEFLRKAGISPEELDRLEEVSGRPEIEEDLYDALGFNDALNAREAATAKLAELELLSPEEAKKMLKALPKSEFTALVETLEDLFPTGAQLESPSSSESSGSFSSSGSPPGSPPEGERTLSSLSPGTLSRLVEAMMSKNKSPVTPRAPKPPSPPPKSPSPSPASKSRVFEARVRTMAYLPPEQQASTLAALSPGERSRMTEAIRKLREDDLLTAAAAEEAVERFHLRIARNRRYQSPAELKDEFEAEEMKNMVAWAKATKLRLFGNKSPESLDDSDRNVLYLLDYVEQEQHKNPDFNVTQTTFADLQDALKNTLARQALLEEETNRLRLIRLEEETNRLKAEYSDGSSSSSEGSGSPSPSEKDRNERRAQLAAEAEDLEKMFEAEIRRLQGKDNELESETKEERQRKDREEIDRIIQLERQGKMQDADILRITRSRRFAAQRDNKKLIESLERRLAEGGTLIDPEVPLTVGRQVRLLGDIEWWPRGQTPPEGEMFQMQVPYSVYRAQGDLTERRQGDISDLSQKRDMYDLQRRKRSKRYHKWDRERNRRDEREEAMDTTEEPETFLNRLGAFFGGAALDVEPLGNALPLDFEYGTMTLADPNEDYDDERNEAMLELLDEYTPLRDDPKTKKRARDMQQQILRTLRKKPNLKLEDPFKVVTDEPTDYDVDEVNWWGQQKWPMAVELEEGLFFRQTTSQTEFEAIAADAYREAKRNQLHRWWWQEFIPQVRNQSNDQLYGRQDRDLNKALKQSANNNSLLNRAHLEDKASRLLKTNQPQDVGDRDYKPLQTPQGAGTLGDVIARNYAPYEASSDEKYKYRPKGDHGLLNKITKDKLEASSNYATSPNQWVTSNPAPFYVGWDETARQFMVTNRYLSREQSGYQMNWNDEFPIFNGDRYLSPDAGDTLTFNKWPFKGLTANATVYNKVLFATYDSDQFFNLGLDGFTPLGWRKFKFRYSAPRVQPLLVHSVETSNLFRIFDTKRPYANLVQHYVSPYLANQSKGVRLLDKAEQADELNEQFKDVDFIHQHPQVPPFFPHGPLLRDVLPVYYVFSLYQRYRLPKDRYIDIVDKVDEPEEPVDAIEDDNADPPEVKTPTLFPDGKLEDFTLRKRVIPDRAYHVKDDPPLGDDELLPFRKPFFGRPGRPSVRPGNLTEVNFPERLREAQESRVRVLRRRVLRKTVRPELRYPPAVGGFVWPGEALHLELVDGSLVPSPEAQEQMKQRAIAEGRAVDGEVAVEPLVGLPLWSPQAVHYFIDTHNRKVLQRRLERTQSKANAYQKLKFMRLHGDPLVV